MMTLSPLPRVNQVNLTRHLFYAGWERPKSPSESRGQLPRPSSAAHRPIIKLWSLFFFFFLRVLEHALASDVVDKRSAAPIVLETVQQTTHSSRSFQQAPFLDQEVSNSKVLPDEVVAHRDYSGQAPGHQRSCGWFIGCLSITVVHSFPSGQVVGFT